MLSDRSYMRDEPQQPPISAVTWMIAVLAACFVLQHIMARWFSAGTAFENVFALSVAGLKAWQVWSLLTYSFLHSTGNLLHLLANGLGLYFLGRMLEPILGTRRFVAVYFTAVFVGGLLWSATHWQTGGMVIGASAGVAALLIVFAGLHPNERMTFLLFFILPVSVKPKHLAFGLLFVDLLGFLFYEIIGASSPFGMAHSAHLGGMAAGWIYVRYLHGATWWQTWERPRMERPAWMRKSPGIPAAKPVYRVNLTDRDGLRAEVDRILDKINSQGFGALSAEEKRLLDEARDLLSRP